MTSDEETGEEHEERTDHLVVYDGTGDWYCPECEEE